MKTRARQFAGIVAGVALAGGISYVAVLAQATTAQQPKKFEPHSGQAGKDVVWVPTPQETVEKMLDLANVTAKDFVMDLGSGDGRTVITAAKRGATAMGVEYNPDMVELSKQNAAAAGVSDKATFVKADLFETDFSKATVITMFLLPDINLKLRPKILQMKPGTRIVSNSFTMDDWETEETVTVENCTSWCTVHFWIVPARVEGTWRLGTNDLVLTQKFQMLSGTLGSAPISDARMRGEEISFTAGGAKYTGRVTGNSMRGSMDGRGSWTATKR